jgi:hypothetical protein
MKMTAFVFAASLFAVTAATAGDAKAATPAIYRMEIVYIFETDTSGAPPESIVVIGNSGFRSVAALKQFISNLPKGAILDWTPGCERLGGELLLSSETDLEDFQAFCRERGITFILHPSG